MNITLPKDLVGLLRDKPNKSAFIAEALREKLEGAEKERRARELSRAYAQACEEEASLTADWDAASGDAL